MNDLSNAPAPTVSTHLLPTLEQGSAVGGPAFQSLFQLSNSATLLVNEAGRIIDANLQAVDLLGRARTELSTYRIGRLVPAATEEFWGRLWSRAGAEHRLQFHTEAIGGDDRPFLLAFEAVRLTGTEHPLVALFLDAEADEQQQREALRLFLLELSRLSHAVGQPATILLSGLELMTQVRGRSPETLDSLIPMALAAAEQLQSLLRQMSTHRHRFQQSIGLERIQAGHWVDRR